MKLAASSTPADLRLSDHVCLIYETEAEHARFLTPYLKAGLERNEKVVYLADYTTGATVLNYLRGAGVDVDPYLRRGQLSIHSTSSAYLPNGTFDPAAMIEFLGEATQQAQDEGFAGLRATGEMTWVLEGRPGCDRILEYESRTNGFFQPGVKAVGLCQYRRSRFDAETLLEILKTHPLASVDCELYQNPYYMPPELYLGGRAAEAMLDRCLSTLRHSPLDRRDAPA